MKIHTVKHGETLSSIAEGYGIPTEIFARVNGLSPKERLLIGEELVVTVPTRTYKAVRTDTAERIALRFGVRKSSLYALNPHIAAKGKGVSKVVQMMIRENILETICQDCKRCGFNSLNINVGQYALQHRGDGDAAIFFFHPFSLLGSKQSNPLAVHFDGRKFGAAYTRVKNKCVCLMIDGGVCLHRLYQRIFFFYGERNAVLLFIASEFYFRDRV